MKRNENQKSSHELQNEILELRKARTKYPPDFVNYGLMLSGIGFFFLGDQIQESYLRGALFVLGGIISLVGIQLFNRASKIDRHLKERVLPAAVRSAYPHLTYYSQSNLTDDELNDSHLPPYRLIETRFFDELRGSFMELDYEIHHVVGTVDHRDDIQLRVLPMKAMYADIQSKRRFAGFTKLVPNKTDSAPVDNGLKRIQLENFDFDKTFVVTTSDEIEARTIFTPKVMEQLLNLGPKQRMNLYCKFSGNRLTFLILNQAMDLELNGKSDLKSITKKVWETVRILECIAGIFINALIDNSNSNRIEYTQPK